ncbi:MAG: hypothetical protein AB1791_20105 [Chloroflexota bacterium]
MPSRTWGCLLLNSIYDNSEMSWRRRVPLIVAWLAGAASLVGLLFAPALAQLLLGWVSFLAAVTLLLGLLNLLAVHSRRALRGNFYSLVLLAGAVIVLALAVTDSLGLTAGGVATVFQVIQAPLEAALAALLAFLLVFAAMRLWRRRRDLNTYLFLGVVLFLLVASLPLPAAWQAWLEPGRALIQKVTVTAGVRGLLIGVALGAVTISLRLLAGVERPYDSQDSWQT